MTRRTPIALSLLVVAALACAACDQNPVSDERAKTLEGGNPIPEGAAAYDFPWIGKQSLTCSGEAVERMVAVVDFSDKDHPALGSATLDAKGGGKAEFRVRAADLKTGDEGRDEHMRGPNWLNATDHPDLVLKIASLERVKPTVWKAKGTWTMHGVEKPVEFLANVRWIGAMSHLADDGVIRVSGSFAIPLKDHGVGGQWVGTPAVAASWNVDVVLLGVRKKS
jgi:hypothetical protein